MLSMFFFFQAEDGIRDLVRSRGLGDVYKRQGLMPIILRKKFDIAFISQMNGLKIIKNQYRGYDLSLIHI